MLQQMQNSPIFFLSLATLHGMWNFSDQGLNPHSRSGSVVLNQWTPREARIAQS